MAKIFNGLNSIDHEKQVNPESNKGEKEKYYPVMKMFVTGLINVELR